MSCRGILSEKFGVGLCFGGIAGDEVIAHVGYDGFEAAAPFWELEFWDRSGVTYCSLEFGGGQVIHLRILYSISSAIFRDLLPFNGCTRLLTPHCHQIAPLPHLQPTFARLSLIHLLKQSPYAHYNNWLQFEKSSPALGNPARALSHRMSSPFCCLYLGMLWVEYLWFMMVCHNN